jgi:hypothetical protein
MLPAMIPDKELDRLYGLPLGEFTRARDETARDLRKQGESEAADEVKALAKPSLSAWAVNQLARHERLQVRALMTAGERLRKAQAKLLGGGASGEVQAALQRQRDVVGALVGSAQDVLQEAGHPATDAMLERIRATLTAAAADEEGARLVATGRLTKDLDPAGFGGVTAVEPAAGRPASPGKEKARTRRVEQAQGKVEALRADLAEQKAELGRAKKEARRAEQAARAASDAAGQAEAELRRLSERLDAALDALERARSG